MPHYFLDTSALVKGYHDEPGSAVVAALFSDRGSSFSIARLAMAEFPSAFAKKLRAGQISDPEFQRILSRFHSDVTQRRFAVARMLNHHFRSAGDLLSKHGRSRHLYALDALQLAVVLSMPRPSPPDFFVCSDQRLIAVARLEGLDVLDPEQP